MNPNRKDMKMEFIMLKRDTRDNSIEEGTKIFVDEQDIFDSVKEIQRITDKNGFPFVYWYERYERYERKP